MMSRICEEAYFKDVPGLEDFPDFTLDVVSPELPCGAGWLANCLLELGLSLWKPWGLDTLREWQRVGPFHYRYVHGPSPLQQTLPALVTCREFIFRREPVPNFSHRWPYTFPDREKVIFFVRDPRDALYSEWRRQQANGRLPINVSFTDFVRGRYYHYPFSFHNYLVLFLRLWKSALSERDHLIVRFEDYKADAMSTLRRVLDFVAVKVSPLDIQRATTLSDFSIGKRIEQERLDKKELLLALNRAGIPFEYRRSYESTMHDSIGPLFDPLFKWLGYESYDEGRRYSHPSVLSNGEVNRLLEAMGTSKVTETKRAKLSGLLRLHAADLTYL